MIIKKSEQNQVFHELAVTTEREREEIEKVAESGQTEMTQSNTHNKLEKELETEVASEKKQIDQLSHLIEKATTTRDQWQKKSDTLHQQLQALMELDKV